MDDKYTQSYRVTFRARPSHERSPAFGWIESAYRRIADNQFETVARGISADDASNLVLWEFNNRFGDDFEIYDCMADDTPIAPTVETTIDGAHAVTDGPAADEPKPAGRTRGKRAVTVAA